MPKYKHDWKEIQKFYDNNHSWNDVQNQFKLSSSTIYKAIKRGEFVSREQSLSQRICFKNYDKRHTEETKKKLSDIRKKYLQENPDKVPYLLNHSSKGDSYPEKYFESLFIKEGISLSKKIQIGIYQLDFCDLNKKIDIEIDGEQHYLDQRIVDSDKRRTKYLEENGWKVFRVRWSDYQKMNMENRKVVVKNIKNLFI